MLQNTDNKFTLSLTESSSTFQNLEKMSIMELVTNINKEDAKVHVAVRKAT